MHLDPFEPPAPQAGQQSAHERRRSTSGFTLIELVIVLVVLAVAGALAIPAVRPALDAVRAEAAVRRTASFLDGVRLRAVLDRKALEVLCRVEDNRLDLEGGQPFPIPAPVILVSCDPGRLRYDPQGSASGLRLLVRDRGGRERRLTVGAFTGLARVDSAGETAAAER